MWTAQGRSRHPQVRVSQPNNDREADHSKCCLLLTPKTRWLFRLDAKHTSAFARSSTQLSLVKYLTAATCSNPLSLPACLTLPPDSALSSSTCAHFLSPLWTLCLYLNLPRPWLPSYSHTCLWPVLNLTSLCLHSSCNYSLPPEICPFLAAAIQPNCSLNWEQRAEQGAAGQCHG